MCGGRLRAWALYAGRRLHVVLARNKMAGCKYSAESQTLNAEGCYIWRRAAAADTIAAQACAAWVGHQPSEQCAQLAPAKLRVPSGAEPSPQ